MAESNLEALETLADEVRQASRCGELVRLDEVWTAGEAEYVGLAATPAAAIIADIEMIRGGGSAYLFSNRHMTRGYAEAAARATAGDHRQLIAETVRCDSATYPRPTPVQAFLFPPFLLAMEEIDAAIERMQGDENYEDIRLARASNGDLFLFSLKHLSRAQAEAMAEWLAVGQQENP